MTFMLYKQNGECKIVIKDSVNLQPNQAVCETCMIDSSNAADGDVSCGAGGGGGGG
eukprot:CAMPEP_0182428104 /NCGR_PEP_ID=MMETSP1167-20130531/21028_1 /TAXON_ID=2988 /ORGANISM="Mallomonas Sp, Strain CCMP3275" /LENGTH=55 /DNA_ID=CAMNT_0024610781 /DNA_START=1 /DNA_END=164 /DNA_ORIENTATION=+